MAAAPKKTKPRKKSQEITYGLLIDILEEVEKECSESGNIPHQLLCKIQLINPDVTVGRESRFYETVKRIAAPTRPSLRGECKLMGSVAQEYREKVWVPRVKNNVQAASTLQFPEDLVHYGLTETLLETVFTEVECYKGSLSWHLRGVPCVGFYKDLHPYLKKWPRSVSATKSLIGRFYIAIDKSLQVKGCRGCRSEIAYQFIEHISISDQLRDSVMKYGYEENEVIVLSHQMEQFCGEIKKLTLCYEAMKEESEKTKCELSCTRQALRDVQRELQVLKHEWDYVEKKLDTFERVDDADFEESTTEEKRRQLSSALQCLQQELSI